MPGTGNAVDGLADTRHRVTAALGVLTSTGPAERCQRRSAMPSVPELSAASCRRREAIMDMRVTSATTVPKPPWRSPSSKQASKARSSGAST